MPLLIKCSSPFAAPRHPHLKAPPHLCCHVCGVHARPCLSTGWASTRRFDQTFGTAAVLVQGGCGGGGELIAPILRIHECLPDSHLCFLHVRCVPQAKFTPN